MTAPDEDVLRGQRCSNVVRLSALVRKRHGRHPAMQRIGVRYALHGYPTNALQAINELLGENPRRFNELRSV